MSKVYITGTFDTKSRELFFIKKYIEKTGLSVITINLSTSTQYSEGNSSVDPKTVAGYHPEGKDAVFTKERGSAVTQMSIAFEHFILQCQDLGGLIGIDSSGGTALITSVMRSLPVGLPKVMVSTMVSGNVSP